MCLTCAHIRREQINIYYHYYCDYFYSCISSQDTTFLLYRTHYYLWVGWGGEGGSGMVIINKENFAGV